MKPYLKITGVIVTLAGLTGCVTFQDTSDVTQQREDLLLLQEDFNRTKGKLETIEMEYQRLLQELNTLQNTAARSKDEIMATQARLDRMDQRLNLLDSARVKDRQAIVDQLSGKITDIIGGGAASPRSKSAARPGSTGTTGYEHIVKEGETLSAIASAYKVSIKAIIEANQLPNPDVLVKGQKVFIPQP